jgi:hypothetical protein
MAKPRLGLGFEGTLFPGRLATTDRRDLDRVIGTPSAPGAIEALLRLLPQADLAIYPLWPGRGRSAFISRWLKRRLREHFHDHPDGPASPTECTMRALDITDRRPDDLDAWIEHAAVEPQAADPLDWTPIAAAMERGWALERRT